MKQLFTNNMQEYPPIHTANTKKIFATKALLCIALLFSSHYMLGQNAFDNNLVRYTDSLGEVFLDMPLLTLPSQSQAYNTTGGFFQSYMNPGLENSLSYSADLYTAAHFGLKKAIRFKNSTFWQKKF